MSNIAATLMLVAIEIMMVTTITALMISLGMPMPEGIVIPAISLVPGSIIFFIITDSVS